MHQVHTTQTHWYNPVTPAYLIWAYYAHGRQRRCQEDPVGLPTCRLEKTTGSSPHHVAQHHLTGSETQTYAPWSSRFGSEPPSVEDDVDVWCYAIVSCMPETTTNEMSFCLFVLFDFQTWMVSWFRSVLYCVLSTTVVYTVWKFDRMWIDWTLADITQQKCFVALVLHLPQWRDCMQ